MGSNSARPNISIGTGDAETPQLGCFPSLSLVIPKIQDNALHHQHISSPNTAMPSTPESTLGASALPPSLVPTSSALLPSALVPSVLLPSALLQSTRCQLTLRSYDCSLMPVTSQDTPLALRSDECSLMTQAPVTSHPSPDPPTAL